MAGQGTRRVAVAPEYNHADNAGFELNQRGTTYTTNGVQTLDRWRLTLGGSSTVTVSQITSTIGAPGNSLQFAYTHVAAGSASLDQKVEHYLQLRGRVVTLAITLKSTVNATVQVYINDSTGTVLSAFNSGTGTQRLTLTTTVSASATALQVGIFCNVATCTVEINDATLVVGGVPADFAPLHPAQDLARCQRYYEKWFDQVSSPNYVAYGAAATNNGMPFAFRATKFAVPTVTKNGTWAVLNCGQPSTGNVDKDFVTIFATVTALGTFSFSANASGQNITIETNP